MNTHWRASIATILLCWATAESASARCAASIDSSVAVEVQAEPVETAFDTSLTVLAEMARKAGRQAHMPLMAIYSSAVLFGSNIETRVQRVDEGFCAEAKSVRVRVVIGRRTIHIARELIGKECLLNTAIAHAESHARSQETLLLAARDRIAANLKQRLSEPGLVESSPVRAERQLTYSVGKQIDADLADADSEKSEASLTIDSLDALAQLRNACPNEQASR